MSAATWTTKVNGTILTLTIGMGSTMDVGEIMDLSGLSTPVNQIPIGSWKDKVKKTRSGRKKLGDVTYQLYLNPDDDVQRQIKEIEGTDTIGTWALIYPEGTIKTRTFDALCVQFGDSAKNDSIYMGSIVLGILTDAVRT